MADQQPAQAPEEKPETEEAEGEDEEVANQKRVIRITADFLDMAADVIREMRHREGDDTVPGEDEEPSLQEMCGVATVIITGKMSGIYAPKVESKSDFKSLLKNIEIMVESKVNTALMKAERERRPGVLPRTQTAIPLPPVAPYTPPPPPKSDMVGIIERMYDRMNACSCFTKDSKCKDCQSLQDAMDTLDKFLSPNDRLTSYDITCECGGVMQVFHRPDHSRGIICITCNAGPRPRAAAVPGP